MGNIDLIIDRIDSFKAEKWKSPSIIILNTSFAEKALSEVKDMVSGFPEDFKPNVIKFYGIRVIRSEDIKDIEIY
jgi:hypothetical protein